MNLLPRLETRCLLTPADLPPSREDFEVIGTFNPAAAQLDDGSVVMLVRVAERPTEIRPGYHPSPRYGPDGEILIDWIADEDVSIADPRMLVYKGTGFQRLTFVNHLRVVRLADGLNVSEIGAIFTGTSPYASFGYEDPRLTRIDDTWYVTAVAPSQYGVSTALLSTDDFDRFTEHGIIFCPENKDVVLFPEKINGRYAAIHRPVGTFGTRQPEMWIGYSPDLIHWGGHRPLFGSRSPHAVATDWDSGRVGGGVPPIRTERGWLKVYHASCKPSAGEPIGVYAAGALLLDLDDPTRVLAHSDEPFMRPEADFERHGFVKAVVFPTGHALRGGDLLLYYGAADTHVGVVRYEMNALLDSLVPLH